MEEEDLRTNNNGIRRGWIKRNSPLNNKKYAKI